MKTPGDLDVLLRALRASGAWRTRRLVAAGVLFSVSLLALLLALFPSGGGEARSALETFESLRTATDPTRFVLFLVIAATLLWVIWAALSGAVMRAAAGALSERPEAKESPLTRSLARWGAHFGAPLFLALGAATLAAIVLGLVQVARLPLVGWPLLALLSPVVVVISAGAVWLAVRFLLAGHLAGAAIAVEETSGFGGLSIAVAHFRSAPVRVLLLRLGTLLLTVVYSAVRIALGAAAVGLPWLLLRWSAPGATGPIEATLTGGLGAVGIAADVGAISVTVVAVAAAAWLASAPLTFLFGARAGLYLVHRRLRDGVEVDAAPPGTKPEKSLEELGVLLVQRLADEAGES